METAELIPSNIERLPRTASALQCSQKQKEVWTQKKIILERIKGIQLPKGLTYDKLRRLTLTQLKARLADSSPELFEFKTTRQRDTEQGIEDKIEETRQLLETAELNNDYDDYKSQTSDSDVDIDCHMPVELPTSESSKSEPKIVKSALPKPKVLPTKIITTTPITVEQQPPPIQPQYVDNNYILQQAIVELQKQLDYLCYKQNESNSSLHRKIDDLTSEVVINNKRQRVHESTHTGKIYNITNATFN